jgi:hypothetical protein
MVEINGSLMNVKAKDLEGEIIDEFVVQQEIRPSHVLGFLTKEGGPGHISDATVQSGSPSTSADSTGYYGLKLMPGDHEIVFSLQDYVTIIDSVNIVAGTETESDQTFSLPTGILSAGHPADKISCYPNPVRDITVVRFQMTAALNTKVMLYNSGGSCVCSYEIYIGQPEHEGMVLDMSGLPSGIYLLCLRSGKEVVTRKVVKL